MSSLFDKLSTLVNAQVNDLLGRNPQSPLARIRLHPEEAEKDPKRSAQTLRRRMDEAVDYEGELQQKINGLTQEALGLDAQVDSCLQRGDQFGARRLQGQLNMKQQQLAIAESELRDHRAVTRHLMQELVSLEAALDDNERQGRSPDEAGDGQRRRTGIPVDSAGLAGAVADKLNEARDNVESLLNRAPPPAPSAAARSKERIVIVDEAPDPRKAKPQRKDRESMDRRLSRLSKPSDDDG